MSLNTFTALIEKAGLESERMRWDRKGQTCAVDIALIHTLEKEKDILGST